MDRAIGRFQDRHRRCLGSEGLGGGYESLEFRNRPYTNRCGCAKPVTLDGNEGPSHEGCGWMLLELNVGQVFSRGVCLAPWSVTSSLWFR